MQDYDLLDEAQRQFSICSACRYCEGYCAVFPALEQKTEYGRADMEYLGSLCHDCRACYQACMYASPHEYAVNIPKLLSEVRGATYKRHVWPKALRGAFMHPSLSFVIAGMFAALVMVTGIALHGNASVLASRHVGSGAFYRVIPYVTLVTTALAVTALAIFALLRGVAEFAIEQRDAGNLRLDKAPKSIWIALWNGLAMTYLRGGGGGCYYPEPGTPAMSRRRLHVLLTLGVLADFVATSVAAVLQDVFGWIPPYPWLSAPVLFGFWGGVAIIVGAGGLLLLKRRSARFLAAEDALARDVALLWQFIGVAASGLLLLFVRSTAVMAPALVIHLSLVAALYVTAPYGKSVHALYRIVALTGYGSGPA